MSSSEERAPIIQRLLEIWKKSEERVAYGLFVLIGIGEHLNIPIVRDSAISFLGLIILSEFFDITKDRVRLRGVLTEIATGVVQLGHAIRPRKRFNNIHDAVPTIMKCIRECHRTDNYVEVQWIGMTMLNAGSSLIFGFNELAEEGSVRDLYLNLAMSDGAWLDANNINRAWDSLRVATAKANLQKSFEARPAAGLNWKCTINHYAHMPAIHGGLINGKYLFLGIAQWIDEDLHAGERQYALYTDQSEDDREKIRIFMGWFGVCRNGRGHRSVAASAASAT